MDRRTFLQTGSAALLAPALTVAGQPAGRLKVALIYTVLRFRSHAHNFLENFVQPYLFNGKIIDPGMDIVSFYADQREPENDRTEELSRRLNIPLYASIDEALTLGRRDLAVDAVLLIGEHGMYQINRLGQTLYPRKRFFDEIVAVFERSKRVVPIFNDKHLAFRWDWAKEIYDTSRRLNIPLMAGSSVPLAQRRPALELPAGAALEEAVTIHGGGLESYDFHAFEVLQSFIEARKGGESGISSVEFLEGDALWKAGQDGRWSVPLAESALRLEFEKEMPDLRRGRMGNNPLEAHGVLLTYKDGLKATVLKIARSSVRWQFACKLAGEREPRATRYFVGPWGNRNLFMALSHAIQHFFRQRRAPYPVERTLLASGMLDAALHSRAAEGRVQRTPHLELAYAPQDFRAFREMGESWRVMADMAEIKDLHTLGRRN